MIVAVFRLPGGRPRLLGGLVASAAGIGGGGTNTVGTDCGVGSSAVGSDAGDVGAHDGLGTIEEVGTDPGLFFCRASLDAERDR